MVAAEVTTAIYPEKSRHHRVSFGKAALFRLITAYVAQRSNDGKTSANISTQLEST